VRALGIDQRDQAIRQIDHPHDSRGSEVADLAPRGALSGALIGL
jgi:hypothetical protein